jgi:hypothetical protein
MNEPLVYAVTDTNVLLDVHSCHDLTTAYNDAYARLGKAAVDDLTVVYRRARARESLLLGMHLNRVKATTYSLHFEPVDLLTKRAPPAAGGATMESDFTNMFLHFVKDYVLPDWNMIMPTQPGTEAKNDADKAYIDYAKQHGLPLITNEGYGQNGLVDEKMRKLAKDAGVAVYAEGVLPGPDRRGRRDRGVPATVQGASARLHGREEETAGRGQDRCGAHLGLRVLPHDPARRGGGAYDPRTPVHHLAA